MINGKIKCTVDFKDKKFLPQYKTGRKLKFQKRYRE